MLILVCLAAGSALAESDAFYGWSKDGSYFVYQSVTGPNDLTELFFCTSEEGIRPTWPKDVNELERTGSPLSCAHYTDLNRAPYGWKAALVLPKPSLQGPGAAKVLTELVFDGERPGYAFEANGKKTVCYVSGLREDSKLGQVYWHPNGRYLAAFIDGHFIHCDVSLRGVTTTAAKPPPPPVKKRTK